MINKFLQLLEKQEKKGFKGLAALLSHLPKTAQGSSRSESMSVAEAMEAGFLPALDEDQADMFTPSELHLYQHAQDHRSLSRDILGYHISRDEVYVGTTIVSQALSAGRVSPR